MTTHKEHEKAFKKAAKAYRIWRAAVEVWDKTFKNCSECNPKKKKGEGQ